MAEAASILRVSNPDEAAAVARFAASVLSRQPDYISHGEIQCGRSPDGEKWAGDLEIRLAAEFAASLTDPGRDLIAARSPSGEINGFAQIVWMNKGADEFGVIEDIAVAPENRGEGLGRQLVGALERLAVSRGASWLWLESGLGNENAHRFFEALGYAPRSKIFGKRLSGAQDEG
jgi:ribosomal protein S18 acetylase RimI-like enzyme